MYEGCRLGEGGYPRIFDKNCLDNSCLNNYIVIMIKNNLKQHIGYWINRIRTQTHLSFESRLEPYGVTVAQWCILAALYDEQATTIKELSLHIDIDKGSISRVVDRLVTKGLVVHGSGKDRRSGHLSLTSGGLALVPFLIQEAEQNEQRFFGMLSEEELHQFQHILRKVIQSSMPTIRLEGWIVAEIETDSSKGRNNDID